MHQDNPVPYNPGPPPPGGAPAPQVLIATRAPVALGPSPQNMTCPSCHAQITSSVKSEPNTKTHIIALLLCLFGCWLCCCIPYCVDSCQSQNHHCPSCGAFLGSHQN